MPLKVKRQICKRKIENEERMNMNEYGWVFENVFTATFFGDELIGSFESVAMRLMYAGAGF